MQLSMTYLGLSSAWSLFYSPKLYSPFFTCPTLHSSGHLINLFTPSVPTKLPTWDTGGACFQSMPRPTPAPATHATALFLAPPTSLDFQLYSPPTHILLLLLSSISRN